MEVLGSGVDSYVYSIAVSGTDVYAGGNFTTAGGNGANYIAKWNGNSWSTLGLGVNSSVSSIAVSGTDVYAGGGFTSAGGNSSIRYVAKWNGSSWSALGLGVNGSVNSIAILGTDIYVGGGFTSAGGNSSIKYLGKWNGSSWLGIGSGVNNIVRTISTSGTDLYVGGDFTIADMSVANRLAKWNGSSWLAIGSGVNNIVRTISTSGTDLYVGGLFSTAGDKVASYFAIYRQSLLPLESITVTARKKNRGIEVSWLTQYEENVHKHVVEKANNIPDNFISIVSVDAKNTVAANYNYFDESPFYGTNYYRIKSIDKDGKTTISKTLRVDYEQDTKIKILPNPVRNSQINIQFNGHKKGVYTASIYTINGQKVFETTFNHTISGTNNYVIRAKQLTAGTYSLIIKKDADINTVQFICD
jgi:hypothetical protein